MVDKNDSLLREVDEELRRERMEKLWQQYGVYVIGAAMVFVAIVGAYKFLEARDRAAAEAGGVQYEAAQALAKSGKTDDAATAMAAIATGDKPGYAVLAELNMAGALQKAGKTADALAAFEKLAAKPGADPLIIGFAQLQAAGLRLGEADFTEVKNRLTPLMADSSAWKAAATEMLGTAAIKAGKLDEARAALAPLLADPRLSRTGVERVKTLLSVVAGMETSQAPVVAPASPPATAVAPEKPSIAPAAASDAKSAEKKPTEKKPEQKKPEQKK